jgi:RNA polymerase sigma-70 factor (ECF subfamily)
MTTSIAPSIFATPILYRLGWHGRLMDERINMIPKKSESKVVPFSDSKSEDAKRLLEQVAQKDVKALSDLYEAYAGLLMTVIYAILKDKGESEDILQESFLAIWYKADMYRPHLGKPTSWMVTIAKNKAYDRYRKLIRRSDGMNVLRESMVGDSISKTVESDTDNEHLLEGFSELNAEQRQAIELVFYQGFTQQEAAEKLETPLGTVKARIRRGLLKLKEYLNNDSPKIKLN